MEHTYLFISDIHLGLQSKETENKKERLLVEFFNSTASACKELFIVGDLFDLWFASEKLKIPYAPLSLSVKKSEIVRDLRKYLPKDFWPVIERLAK